MIEGKDGREELQKTEGITSLGGKCKLTCGKCLAGDGRCRGELELPKRRSFQGSHKNSADCGGRGPMREEEELHEEESSLSLSLQRKEN